MIWFWAFWVIAIAVTFAIAEGWALKTGRITLSRSVWTWSQNWPPLPFVVGLLAGFLAAHFFWQCQGICPWH